MNVQLWPILVVVLWMSLFLIGVALLFRWRVKRSGLRPPLEEKLLRGPGESLRRKVAAYDEKLIEWGMLAALVPLILGWLTLFGISRGGRDFAAAALAGGALVFAATLVTSITWLLRKLNYRRNCALGYYGERIVAEHLGPLMRRGYHVFHDLPAKGRQKDFNLDHVVVGPAGVVVIETKTRRKGRCRPGYEPTKVRFDGNHLIWPWTEDRFGIDQVINSAEWLRKWLFDRTGQDFPVRAILTFPGWYVAETPTVGIRVINPSFLENAVHNTRTQILSDEQIDLIARQLDSICRDVED